MKFKGLTLNTRWINSILSSDKYCGILVYLTYKKKKIPFPAQNFIIAV